MPYPIIILAIVAGVVISVISAKSKAEAAKRAAQQRDLARKRALEDAAGSVNARNAAAKQQELKRNTDDGRDRSRLERQTLVKESRPVIDREEDDCGGGSIHDGYHEGVTKFSPDRPAAVAGKLGSRLADEDDRIAREKLAAENAKRAMERISKLPPLAQGVVWSELLGRPKSETTKA
ncbi:MAG: hypothetical protein J5854_06245 [Clostridia bacterium]|nr:hypothetical protein [Clostridia bacterium]